MKRVLTKTDLPFDAVFPTLDGRCAKCNAELKGKQKRWCSKACADDAWIEINVRRGISTFIRKALQDRDKEICAKCGTDLNLVRQVLKKAERSLWEWPGSFDLQRLLRDIVIWPVYGETGSYGQFWQGDHILEVKAGGSHTLDNLQTLCTVCHKAKTAKFASQRRADNK